MYPDDLQYTSEHEWLRTGDDQSVVRVGVTQYAQEALGDIVYVSLPDEGEHVETGQVIGEIESTKSVSEIYAPLTGTVRARNGGLDDQPDLINSDPYGEGWMVDLAPDDASEASSDVLMDATAYQEMVGKE